MKRVAHIWIESEIATDVIPPTNSHTRTKVAKNQTALLPDSKSPCVIPGTTVATTFHSIATNVSSMKIWQKDVRKRSVTEL